MDLKTRTTDDAEQLNVSISDDLDCTVVQLEGELDLYSAVVLEAAVAGLPICRPLVVDLGKVYFIDAAGVGGLIRISRGRTVHLVNPTLAVVRTFDAADVKELLAPELHRYVTPGTPFVPAGSGRPPDGSDGSALGGRVETLLGGVRLRRLVADEGT